MSAPSIGREARRRRIKLGLSQARVAGSLGVSATQIGRWERGEAAPTPAQVRALADVLDLGSEEVDSWIDEITIESAGPLISVEIVGDELDASVPDPWSVPPHKRIAPPVLDRDALIGRQASSAVLSDDKRGTAEWALRRDAWRDERRIRREIQADLRRTRAMEAQAARRKGEQEARQVRTGPLPIAIPGSLAAQVAAPAGAANTGSVFPVPDTRRQSEMVTYHSVEGDPAPDDRVTYATRLLMTIAVLVGLAGLLWWALGAFGEGIGSVLDLFRGDEPEPDSIVGALRMIGWV